MTDMYDDDQYSVAPPPAPPPLTPQGTVRRRPGLNRRMAMSLTAAGLITGGFAGGYVISHAATSSTATPSPSSGSGSGSAAAAPSPGTFHPNENPSHEAGESAQREAQENAGQMPTVP